MTSKDDSMKSQDKLEQDTPKSGVSRRQFLTVGSAAVAVLAFQGRANADSTPSPQLISQVPAELPSIVVPPEGSPFVQPKFKLSENGVLQEELIAQKTTLQFKEKSIGLWSYNNQCPGPTLYANSGDTIKIALKNQLPENPDAENCPSRAEQNLPNCFNTTNLHFHGFHVSPSSKKNEQGEIIFSSDDSLVEIEPGKTHEYLVKLPDYHAPGTHWYHPHRHGSTAKQMAPGMAGALIIKEPAKEKIVADSEDKVWLIQEVNTTAADIYNPAPGRNPPDFLVNGIYRPSISMQTGKMQRWRFLNGCVTPSGFLRLKLCKYSDNPAAELDSSTTYTDDQVRPMYLIAADGISFYGKAPQEYSTNESYKFAPGNRADFLILLNEPGTYKLITEQYPKTPATRNEVLAYVRVEAPVGYIALSPDQIPAIIPGDASKYPYLETITASEIVNKDPQDPVATDPPRDKQRPLTFTASGANGGTFKINDKKFHDPGTTYTVSVNTAEEWVLDNEPPSDGRGVAPHPFHIHVNPFQVVAVGEKDDQNQITWKVIPEDRRIWHDTIAVEPNQPLKIWHRFATYPGEFVLHCHILIHEDQGMMYSVEVDGNGPGPGDAVPPIA